jgi:hypothetical protein
MGSRMRRGAGAAAAGTVVLLTLGGAGGAGAAGPSPAGSSAGAAPARCAPSVSGTVTGVGSGSFTLTESDGTVVTVTTTATTVVAETGAAVPPTGVAVGEQVTVTTVPGTSPTATSVTATRVLVVLTHVLGTVVSVGVASFDVQLVGGLVVTVGTDPATAVRKTGVAQPGVSVGEYVTAYGAADPSDPSRLDAQFVVISSPPAAHRGSASGGHTGSWGLLAGAVSGSSAGGFTLTEPDGTVVTVTTTPSTTYGETGSPTAPSGVSDGEQVRVRPVDGTPSSATSVTAGRVVVVLTQVTGVVRSVGTGTFTVQLFGGLVLTVETTGATTYAVDGAPATGVATGEKVTAYGAPDPSAPAQLVARFVDLHPQPTPGGHDGRPGAGGPSGGGGTGADGDSHGDGNHRTAGPVATDAADTFLWGSVRSVTGDDIVVEEPSGTTVTVVVSSSTRYGGPSGASGLAGVTPGTAVGVAGTPAGAGQVDAQVVVVGDVPTTGGHGGWTGGGATSPTTPVGAGAPGTGDGGTPGGPQAGGHWPSDPATTTTIPSAPTTPSVPSTGPSPSTGAGGPGWPHPSGGAGAGDGRGAGSGGWHGTGPAGTGG